MMKRSRRDDLTQFDGSATPSARKTPAWAPADPARLAIPLLAATLLLATLPRLAPGVCWEDSGDLQTASAVLGIAHPPGYAGYVSIGFLITRLPGVDPAYVINLACLICGVVAIALCARLQISLGADAWIAAAACLGLAAHPEVWPQLIIPEVYMPSLALAAGVAAAVLVWDKTGRRWWLTLASLLAGLLAASRPPFVLTLPTLAAVYCWMSRRKGVGWRGVALRALPQLLVFAAPIAYCCAYVWLRDSSVNPYNYIESYRADHPDLLPAADNVSDRIERIVWLVTARQYYDTFVSDIAELAAQTTLVAKRLFVYTIPVSLGAAGLIAAGVIIAWRRWAPVALLITGLAAGALVYSLAYRVHGFAANLLPALLAAAIFAGVGLSKSLAGLTPARWRGAAPLLFVAACVWVVWSARDRSGAVYDVDARRFVAAVDLTLLPERAVVFSEWRTSPPLSYAKLVLANRPDIRIINAEQKNWLNRAIPYLDGVGTQGRPVFFVEWVAAPAPFRLTERGRLWEFESLP